MYEVIYEKAISKNTTDWCKIICINIYCRICLLNYKCTCFTVKPLNQNVPHQNYVVKWNETLLGHSTLIEEWSVEQQEPQIFFMFDIVDSVKFGEWEYEFYKMCWTRNPLMYKSKEYVFLKKLDFSDCNHWALPLYTIQKINAPSYPV